MSCYTLVRKRLKIGPSYLPALRKCCLLLHCQVSQREVIEQNSTKVCDMLGSEPICKHTWKIWVVSSHINRGAKSCLFWDGFSARQNYARCQYNKIEVLPTFRKRWHDYCASVIRWRRIMNVKKTIDKMSLVNVILSLVSRDPKRF